MSMTYVLEKTRNQNSRFKCFIYKESSVSSGKLPTAAMPGQKGHFAWNWGEGATRAACRQTAWDLLQDATRSQLDAFEAFEAFALEVASKEWNGNQIKITREEIVQKLPELKKEQLRMQIGGIAA